jgi:membrane-bound lytic murein transglycosylase D
MRYIGSILLVLLLSLFSVHANETSIAYQDVSVVLPPLDDMSVPDGFDSNLDSLLYVFRENTTSFDDCFSAETNEMLPDSVYIKRLQQIPAIMELSYNSIVKRYIEVYTVKKRKQVEYMLGVGKYYFPIFEQALDIAGLPLELKYLPVIESALNPKAFSRAGASGLWQFMYSTGKIYGLEGNSLVDERRDPIKSTNAAVKYLKDLHNIYNDWALVIAAYNCGPGNVNKAIRKAGGKRDYWAIYNYLPRETRGYVPAFIAATYTITYYKEHDFCAAPIEMPITCDTIMFSERVHLVQIAEVLGIELSVLQSLNPQYRRDIIPGNGIPYTLCLPQTQVNNFLDKKDEILAHKEKELNTNRVVVEPAAGDPYYGLKKYKVKKGDTLSTIAKKNKVKVAQIKKLNNLRSDNIRVGQTLRLR